MRIALSLLLVCASASAAVCFDHGTPREVRESARRAQMQYENAGATLPRIRVKFDKRGAIVPFGFYAVALPAAGATSMSDCAFFGDSAGATVTAKDKEKKPE